MYFLLDFETLYIHLPPWKMFITKKINSLDPVPTTICWGSILSPSFWCHWDIAFRNSNVPVKENPFYKPILDSINVLNVLNSLMIQSWQESIQGKIWQRTKVKVQPYVITHIFPKSRSGTEKFRLGIAQNSSNQPELGLELNLFPLLTSTKDMSAY